MSRDSNSVFPLESGRFATERFASVPERDLIVRRRVGLAV
jgi:hypothetical protein